MKRCIQALVTDIALAVATGLAQEACAQPNAATTPKHSPANPALYFKCTLDEEPTWIRGCAVDLTTGRNGGARTCTSSPPPGSVMLQAQEVRTSQNNGDLTLSVIQTNQKFSWAEDIERAYSDLIDDLAEGEYTDDKGRKANKIAIKLKEEMSSKVKEATSFESSHQVALLRANTNNRDRFDNRRSWSKGYVAMYVKCVAPGDMLDQLVKKYGLKAKSKPQPVQKVKGGDSKAK